VGLHPGSRFGSFEITSLLGAGGMGEVYRARDTTLGRDVALKLLPDSMRLDPARRARFADEARILASLNHPNIAAIYGVEEGAGVSALVLELVDGETLATRISRGPISVGDALAIARQIAEALDVAHEKGIVHRDLKPSNITVTPTGLVKVLDFGVAKIVAPVSVLDETRTAGVTREGLVVGTAAYMSPEQARGQAVDKRTDIWAFGCVLYEMLTGQRLFEGEGTTDTLALLFTKEPDWGALPPNVSPAVRALLRRCLERERHRRISDVAALRFALEDVGGSGDQPVASAPGVVHSSTDGDRRRFRLITATVVVAAAAAVILSVAAGPGVWNSGTSSESAR
jgi:serine/threonine protein kinase